ncbi:MAG TPA: SGNH/GDSL hydrolase family protein [Sphingobacteriaceae bacterium]|nr:SGNH/GDSL hydrolase family protein [Sphingobacteriaceae bacterium]
MRSLIIIFSAFLFTTCQKGNKNIFIPKDVIKPAIESKGNYNYLALGDSYTIGQGVSLAESFPYQLANTLTKAGYTIPAPKIIATTGWTTDQLIQAIKKENITSRYDIVTLLIGVNNQYQGYSEVTYRKEFIELLNIASAYAKGKEHVFVLSIPDWGVTPYAGNGLSSSISIEIDRFNAINKEEALKAGIAYIDITPISRAAATDPLLIASDGLHPSGKMYSMWVDLLAPLVQNKIK